MSQLTVIFHDWHPKESLFCVSRRLDRVTVRVDHAPLTSGAFCSHDPQSPQWLRFLHLALHDLTSENPRKDLRKKQVER